MNTLNLAEKNIGNIISSISSIHIGKVHIILLIDELTSCVSSSHYTFVKYHIAQDVCICYRVDMIWLWLQLGVSSRRWWCCIIVDGGV